MMKMAVVAWFLCGVLVAVVFAIQTFLKQGLDGFATPAVITVSLYLIVSGPIGFFVLIDFWRNE